MPIAINVAALIPWAFVIGVTLIGVALEAVLRWHGRFKSLAALRGTLVMYALAIGISLAPFAAVGKGEIIQDRLVSLIATIASIILIERLAVQGISSFGLKHTQGISSVSILVSVVRMTVLIIGALIVFQSLGIAIAPIITALGVGGLAVALALQTTLANLFAGIQILAARQMRPGDFIKMSDGSQGFIKDISWRTTSINDLSNNIIIVPNATLATATLINYSLPTRSVLTSVNVMVRHGASFEKVQEIAIEAASPVGKDPYVRFLGITDGGISLAVYFTVPGFSDQMRAKSEFVQRFYEQSTREGIMLPSQPWAEMTAPEPEAAGSIN